MLSQPALISYFVKELYEAKSFEERFKVYEKYIKLLGFDGGTYTYIPKVRLETKLSSTLIFAHTDEYPTDFLEQYSEEGLDKKDFTLRKAQDLSKDNQVFSMDWREYEKQGQINHDELDLIVLAREEYKIKNAITIPTLHPHGISGTSLISSETDKNFSQLKQESIETALCCARIFHDRNVADANSPHEFVLPILENLTSTEKEVLCHLASGGILKTISDSTDVSYKYAGNLLGDLRKKMGHISRDRLMYLAGLLNLLDYR